MKMPQQGERLVVYGGTAVTMNENNHVVEDAVIEIADGAIRGIRSDGHYVPPAGCRRLNANGGLILPGLVNGHTHVGMSLLRGIADDLPLQRWLTEVIFPMERKWGTKDFVRVGTQLSAIEMIRSGTTLINDMYYFEETAAQTIQDIGLRAICGQTVVAISGVPCPQTNLQTNFDQYVSRLEPLSLVTPAIAPHSVYGVSRETMELIMAYTKEKKLLVHLHLSETEEENKQCLERYGKTPVQYLDELGLWEHRVVAAHATCLTDEDISVLGRNRVGVSYNPESNLKLGTKICPVQALRASGARVALGTDSVASNNNLDLFQEVDCGAKLQTLRLGVGKLTNLDFVKIMTIEGASALGMDDQVGSLEVGKQADLIVLNTDQAHWIPMYNIYSHLVYSAVGSDVVHTVVKGNVLMEDRVLKTVDESSVLKEARDWGKKISKNG